MPDLDNVSDVGHGAGVLVLPLDVTDVPHHHVHDCVLNQAEEHEEGARGHEHVDSLEMQAHEDHYVIFTQHKP